MVNFRFNERWIKRELSFLMMSQKSNSLLSSWNIYTSKTNQREESRRRKTMCFLWLLDSLEDWNSEEDESMCCLMNTKENSESIEGSLFTHSDTHSQQLYWTTEQISERFNYCCDIKALLQLRSILTFQLIDWEIVLLCCIYKMESKNRQELEKLTKRTKTNKNEQKRTKYFFE